jgi:hypothetical protein
MPRRNYTNDTRCRPVPPGDASLQYLRTARTEPCAVCEESLPPGWPYPEHARCLTNQPERNNR